MSLALEDFSIVNDWQIDAFTLEKRKKLGKTRPKCPLQTARKTRWGRAT